MTHIIPAHWRGSLRDLPAIVNAIRRSWALGRLTLRSTTHIGLIHLYFHAGKLVHVVSNSGDANATLADIQHWTQAMVHFDRGIVTTVHNVSVEHERLFDNLLLQLQRPYTSPIPARPRLSPRIPPPPESRPISPRPQLQRVVDSHIVATPEVEQLITPLEWRILIEAIRRVSLAVARLVGPQEAMNVLSDILEDFSSAFPALSCLHIAPDGYLQVVRTAQLDHIPRTEVIEGFAALIATCRYFCSPMIGEENSGKLILQALNGISPALASLGVFVL